MLKILILLLSIIVVVYNYHRRQLISSSSAWIFCYDLIFVLYPLYRNEEFRNGQTIDIMALCGILVFLVGLIFGGKIKFSDGNSNFVSKYLVPNFSTAYLMFWVGLTSSCVVMYLVFGYSQIFSVLIGDMTGKQMMLYEGGFGANIYSCFLHFTEACLIAICISANGGKEVFKATLCLLLYMFITIRFGFTRIFLLSLLAIIFMFLIRHYKQKSQLLISVAGICILAVLMIMMNYIRCSGFNSDVDFEQYFKIDYVFESTDFGASYYWFDKLLEYDSPFISVLAYLKPFLVFIPRFIWENKPEQTSMQVLKMIDPDLAASGYSTAGYSVIGEGYLMMGVVGVVLFPLMWGILCGYLEKKYYERLTDGNDHCINNIYYYIFAVFIVISGQRGDWNQYMFVVLWLYFLPIYLTTYRVKVRC